MLGVSLLKVQYLFKTIICSSVRMTKSHKIPFNPTLYPVLLHWTFTSNSRLRENGNVNASFSMTPHISSTMVLRTTWEAKRGLSCNETLTDGMGLSPCCRFMLNL